MDLPSGERNSHGKEEGGRGGWGRGVEVVAVEGVAGILKCDHVCEWLGGGARGEDFRRCVRGDG
jgi:hypothetical protein